MTYTQQEVEFMIASAIAQTEHLERERWERGIRRELSAELAEEVIVAISGEHGDDAH